MNKNIRHTIAICLNNWRKTHSVKDTSKNVNLNIKTVYKYLKQSKQYKKQKYFSNSFVEQMRRKKSPFRKRLAICLSIWKQSKSIKEMCKKLKINKKTISKTLLYSRAYQNRKHRYHGNRLKRQRQKQLEINVKNSNYRNKIALCLKTWKKTRSIQMTCKLTNIPDHIVVELLNSSKKFKNRLKSTPQNAHYITQWGRKKWAINILGGKCNNCGNTSIFVLEFHHAFKNKEASISNLIRKGDGNGKSLNSLKSEIKKCTLLCRNCHQEAHHPNAKNKKHKKELMRINGHNKCTKCGYAKNSSCIEFHHHIPKNKKFQIGEISDPRRNLITLQKYKKEIKKCIILCSNCHQKEHINLLKFQKAKLLIEIKSRLIDCGYHIKL